MRRTPRTPGSYAKTGRGAARPLRRSAAFREKGLTLAAFHDMALRAVRPNPSRAVSPAVLGEGAPSKRRTAARAEPKPPIADISRLCKVFPL